jgi:hypothetical protein
LSRMTWVWGDFIVQWGEGKPFLGLILFCGWNELQKKFEYIFDSWFEMKHLDIVDLIRSSIAFPNMVVIGGR